MSKRLIIGISATVVAIGGIIAYRYFVPPSFLIIRDIPSTHSGEYSFGGVTNPYGNGSGVQQGRMGWQLETKMNPDGTTTFNLLKNKKFIKELAIK